jgi:hypothetical protein
MSASTSRAAATDSSPGRKPGDHADRMTQARFGGRHENSPALQCWVNEPKPIREPLKRATEFIVDALQPQPSVSRTPGLYSGNDPTDESVGYFHSSAADWRSRSVTSNTDIRSRPPLHASCPRTDLGFGLGSVSSERLSGSNLECGNLLPLWYAAPRRRNSYSAGSSRIEWCNRCESAQPTA